MDPRQLREERSRLIGQARAIIEAAEAANRDLTQEEQNQYDTLMTQVDSLRTRIERAERQAALDAEMRASQNTPLHQQDDSQGQGQGEQRTQEQVEAERRMASFRQLLPRWISNDYRGITQEEVRALQADLDVSGGYLRPPQQFNEEILRNIDDETFIRQWATTFTVTGADSLGTPTLENDPDDADWTTELATGSEDNTMSFGKRELHPHPLAKRIKVSRKLIRAVPNADEFVRGRLAYKFGITYEKNCLTGDGNKKPLGVFVASTSGISTGRDVSAGNTATAMTPDGLINAKYTLKPAYWPMARWLFHRDGVKQIAKFKDAEGQYLWRESVRAGEPDRLLNLPLSMSEYAPSVFTSGLYVGILGAFKHYWIVDALTLEFQMLNELYAETNQVGLIGRLESDGQPVLEEAFVRVKLA